MSNVGTAIASNENNHHNATQLTCTTAARARCCERDACFEPATENSMALSTADYMAHRCDLWHSSNRHHALPGKLFLRWGQTRISQQRSREGGAHSGTQHEHALLLQQQARCCQKPQRLAPLSPPPHLLLRLKLELQRQEWRQRIFLLIVSLALQPWTMKST